MPPEYSRKTLTRNGAASVAAGAVAVGLALLPGLPDLVSVGSELQLLSNEIVPKSTPASRKQRKKREAGSPTETDIGIGKALGKVLGRSIGITQRNARRPET
jgi:hypothetical protein